MSELAVAPDLGAAPVERAKRRRPLLRFVARRLATGVLTLLVASVVVFLGTSVVPGSPATAVLGRGASAKQVAAIDHRIGYDKPVYTRYANWLGTRPRGNLGKSAVPRSRGTSSAIWPIIRSPLANTTTLALVTVILLIPLSLLFGLIAGLTRRGLAGPPHLDAVDDLHGDAGVRRRLDPGRASSRSCSRCCPPVSLLAPGAIGARAPEHSSCCRY